MAWGILIPWLWIKPRPLAVRAQNPNLWTAREFLEGQLLLEWYIHCSNPHSTTALGKSDFKDEVCWTLTLNGLWNVTIWKAVSLCPEPCSHHEEWIFLLLHQRRSSIPLAQSLSEKEDNRLKRMQWKLVKMTFIIILWGLFIFPF